MIFHLLIITLGFQKILGELAHVKSIKIFSLIQSRFATTHISSILVNNDNFTTESLFHLDLPEEAYITNLTIEADGKLYNGLIKEASKAQATFYSAKVQGQSAALIASSTRETNIFTMSISMEPQTTVSINVTYQELLKRIQGFYKHVVTIDPKQIVEDLQIETFVVERAELATLRSPRVESRLGEESNVDLSTLPDSPDVVVTANVDPNLSTAQIQYKPDALAQQRLLANNQPNQVITLYDVKRDSSEGQIETVNGYFVQFFSPKGLSAGSKQIVFVLDKSGSMQGNKLIQMKEAIKAILTDLKPSDSFNLVVFSGVVRIWQNSSVLAEPANIKTAMVIIDSLIAAGGTNLYDAILTGLSVFNENIKSLSKIMLFLTDGRATNGEKDDNKLLETVKLINSSANINCVAFGDDADYTFLKKLASQTGGLARKIYPDSDAALQIKGFYDQIGSPLLANIQIKYLEDSTVTDTIVQSDRGLLNDGGEMIVAGKFKSLIDFTKNEAAKKKNRLIGTITGTAASGTRRFEVNQTISSSECTKNDSSANCTTETRRAKLPKTVTHKISAVNTVGGFVERMWAYLTIKKLLTQADYKETDPVKQEELRRKALDLSLTYQFVTEVTSVIVATSNTFLNRATNDVDSGKPPRQTRIVKQPQLIQRSSKSIARTTGKSSGIQLRSLLDSSNRSISITSTSCYRVKSAQRHGFDLIYFKKFRNVTSANDCATRCLSESFCRFSLFTPSTSDCQWTSHYRLPSCETKPESLVGDKQVILYCITC